jgi:hypothetical protein
MRFFIVQVFASVTLLACNAPDKPIPDNQENRMSMAKVLVNAYPSASYGASLKQRLAQMAGNAVADDARDNLLSAVSPVEIERKRIELLVKNFTAEELKALAEFAATPAGRRALEKLPNFEQDFTDYLVPYLVQALSFGREASPAAAATAAPSTTGGSATTAPAG